MTVIAWVLGRAKEPSTYAGLSGPVIAERGQ